jgi:putative intracellular protease/amidase
MLLVTNMIKNTFKIKNLIIFIAFLGIALFINPIVKAESQAYPEKPPKDIKVMVLVASGVGITYFNATEVFESWGWVVTTAVVSATISSCHRNDPTIINSDILISEVDWYLLQQYDCIFIPSGGHWDALSSYEPTLELINTAYYSGLIISSLCVGIVVLARASIVNGVKIAYDANSQTYVEEAGGILIDELVVSDKRIITGGSGGGLYGGGASVGPINETCIAIAQSLINRNFSFTLTIGLAIGFISSEILIVMLYSYKKRITSR